jgi:hypothetical protein
VFWEDRGPCLPRPGFRSIIRLNRQYASQERTSTEAELEKVKEAISEMLTAEQKTRLKALAGAKCDDRLQEEARSLRLLQASQTSPNARGKGFGGNTPKSKTSKAVCEGTSGKPPPPSPPQWTSLQGYAPDTSAVRERKQENVPWIQQQHGNRHAKSGILLFPTSASV